MKRAKTPVSKGNSLKSNRTPMAPAPLGKIRVPAARKGMAKNSTPSRGKAGALY